MIVEFLKEIIKFKGRVPHEGCASEKVRREAKHVGYAVFRNGHWRITAEGQRLLALSRKPRPMNIKVATPKDFVSAWLAERNHTRAVLGLERSRVRQELMADLASAYPNMANGRIGILVGGIESSTVIYALRKHGVYKMKERQVGTGNKNPNPEVRARYAEREAQRRAEARKLAGRTLYSERLEATHVRAEG